MSTHFYRTLYHGWTTRVTRGHGPGSKVRGDEKEVATALLFIKYGMPIKSSTLSITALDARFLSVLQVVRHGDGP